MILNYKNYTITGTVEEILDFIQAKEGVTLSNGNNITYLGKTMFDAINEVQLCDREGATCEPNIEEEKRWRHFRSIVSIEDYKKHKDFYSQFISELDQNDPRFYILYLTEKENNKLCEQERKWLLEKKKR